MTNTMGHGGTEMPEDTIGNGGQENDGPFVDKGEGCNNGIMNYDTGVATNGNCNEVIVMNQSDWVENTGGMNTTTLQPSGEENVKQIEKATTTHSAKGDIKGDTKVGNECVMRDMRCIKHDCEIKKVKSSVKKWAFLTKKNQWGYKYSSVTRLICISGGEVKGPGRCQTGQTQGISRNSGVGGRNNADTGLVNSENVDRKAAK